MHAAACQSHHFRYPARLPSTAPIACRPCRLIPGIVALILLLSIGPGLAAGAPEELYPIAVSRDALVGVVPGAIIDNLFEGGAPGQFGWLSWSGSPSEQLLALSLQPPGNSMTYVNPDAPRDNVPWPGKWVCGKPGVSNSRGVRDALDALLARDAVVPVWDAARGKGAHAQYRIVAFARIRLLDYRLGGRGRIRARFLGFVHCGEANRAPAVDAGPDQTAWLGERVQLEGAAQDDGLPPDATLSIAWSLEEGPGAATFQSAGSLCTHVSFDLPGVYRLRLEVSDTKLTGSDEVTVSVAQPNRPPVGFPMALELLEDNEAVVLLEGIDPDGDALEFNLLDAPEHGVLSGSPPNLVFTPAPDFWGTDQFEFVVNDGELDSAAATVLIEVLPVNDPPGVSAGLDQVFYLDQGGMLDGGVTDDGTPTGAGLEWHWSVVSGPGVGYLDQPGSLDCGIRFDAPGTYVLRLTASDTELSTFDELTITVLPRNLKPVVHAGEDQLIAYPSPALIQGTASDDGLPEGGEMVVLWEKAGGPGTVTFTEPHSLSTQARFDQPGRYRLRLSVSDSELPASDELEIIANQTPVANAGPDLVATVGQPIRFLGTILDDDLPAGELHAAWNRLDGPSTAFIVQPDAPGTETLFLTPGTYNFRLTVTDGHLSAHDDLQVLVRPAGENLPPLADAGPNRYIAGTNTVQMHGHATDDGLPLEGTLLVSWMVVDGPGEVAFDTASRTNALARFGAAGLYDLQMSVSDGEFTVADTVSFSVYPDNQPPVVDAGPDQTVSSGPAWLTANVTDDGLPAGAALSLRWELGSGPGEVQWADPDQALARAMFSEPGVYTLRLSASDSELEAGDAVIVTVTGNQAPRVNAGPDQLLDLFVPGEAPPSITLYPFLPSRWDYSIGQPGLSGSWVRPNSLASSGTDLYLGGAFTTAGDVEVRSMAKWDGCAYSALYDARPINPDDPGSAPIGFIAHTGTTEPIAARGDEVFVAGGFLRDLDQDGFLDFTARWTGTGWESWGFKIASSFVTSRAFLATPEAVYFAGQFKFQTSNVPAAPVSFNIGKWNGQDWERLGEGIRDLRDTPALNSIQYGVVNALALAPNGDLYAGGQFVTQTPTGLATNLARWDGTNWAPVSPVALEGCHGFVCDPAIHALAFDEIGDLYAGGNFTTAGDLNTPCIARWDGIQWWPVGDGFNQMVQALAFHGGDLYAGGSFTHSGSQLVNRLARWDGTAWHPLENGLSSHVCALASTPAGLYAGGDFTFANGLPSSLIAKWGHEERLTVLGPDPVTVASGASVPITLEVGHPCGRPLTVAWSVDGALPLQIDRLEEGEAIEPVPLTFEHLYPPGVHSVIAELDDGVGEPVLFSTSVTVLAPATTTLEGWAGDDGLPANGSLSTRWEASEMAGPVSLADPRQLTTVAAFTEPGSYRLALTADDSEFAVQDDLEINVRPFGELNLPPSAHAGRNRTVLLSDRVTLAGVAIDDALPGPDLELGWVQISGPGTVAIELLDLTDLTTDPAARSVGRNATVSFTLPGSYRFRCVAGDTQFSRSDEVDIHVLDLVNHSPSVSAGPHQVVSCASEAILFAHAQDDGLPAGTLLRGWTQIAGPGGVALHRDNDAWFARFSLPGEYVLRFTAYDGTLSAHADVRVSVFEQTPGPAVTLDSPADGDSITSSCALAGSVTGDQLVSWQVVARPVAATTADSPWTVVAQGESVVQGLIGQLDPTLLPNGPYELRLEATDRLGQRASTDPIAILLEGQFKPGRFTLVFNDLSVPLAGLPIRVSRIYDSHRARLDQPGDFGVGWHLELNSITLRKNRPLGRNWEQLHSGGWYQLDPVRPREVVITFPDDRVLRFQAHLSPDLQFGYPIASARLEFISGSPGRLEVEGSNLATIDGFTGPVDLIDLGGFTDFNPTRFRYTTPEGDAYVIDELSGLVSASDRHGNTLTLDEYGIHHSSGVSVRFLRDAGGYIREIIDPAGQVIRYDRDLEGNLASVTARDGLLSRLDYQQPAFPHHLTQITDPLGTPALRTDYDNDGRMIRQTDAHGRTYEFERNLAQRHELIRDRAGHATLLEYDDRGNVTRHTDPLGAVTAFEYDPYDHLIRRTDPLGYATAFGYDAQFNLQSQTDPLGHTTLFTHDSLRRLTAVTDPRGFTIAYVHEPGLIRVVDPLGSATTMGLNPAGLLTSLTNALGHVTHFEYDQHGRLVRETDPEGRTMLFTHDDLGRPVETTRTTAQGNTETPRVQFEYDASDRITRAIAPDGTQSTQVYDATGNLIRQDDPRSTAFHYDLAGRHVQTVFPDLATVQYQYDAEGRLIAATNALGAATQIHRNPVGRPLAIVHPDGATVSAQYDLAGQLIALTDARGATTLIGYDPAGRVVALTNALGEVTEFDYDPNGNRTAIRNGAGHRTGFDYDPRNQLVAVRHPDGTRERFEYDALGRPVAATDQAGLTTGFGYEPGGLLSSVTNAAGHVTRFVYDPFGRCTSQADAAGRVTRFQYDPAARLTRRILPNGESESFDHDAAGNLIAHTDFNGHTTRYQYDALDRLLERIPDPAFGAPAIAYTYNAAGLRTAMTDGTGLTSYQYDAGNRRTRKSWQPAGLEEPLTLEYDHDPAGNLTGLRSTHPNGVQLEYEYDALNRLERVLDPGADAAAPLATEYAYDLAGDLASITLANGLLTRHQHDLLHRLTNSVSLHPAAGNVAGFEYALAPTGHRLAAISSMAGAPVRRHDYAYDPLHQLTGETLDTGNTRGQLSYNYDATGNRLARTVTGPGFGTLSSSTHYYDFNDRLAGDRYDANGNTLESLLPAPFHLPVTDRFDFENRLVQRRAWIEGQPWTVDRYHDGDGRLVAQTVDGATTYYLVDDLNPSGQSQVLEELVLASNTLIPVRIHAFGHALLHQHQLEAGPDNGLRWQIRFHGTDAHGNVRYLTDSAGEVTDTWDYDAFGNVIERSGQSGNGYLFAGQRLHPSLLLYDLRARLYQPDSGRFWTPDPFPGVRAEPSSLHPYLFAANDPVNRLDPTGHFSALSMSLGVTYGLSMRTLYNGVSLQAGFGLVQTLENLEAGLSDEEILLDYFLASTRDVALGFGTAYAVRALWPALLRVASQPLASLAQSYSKSSAALHSWRNGTILSARQLVGRTAAARFGTFGSAAHQIPTPHGPAIQAPTAAAQAALGQIQRGAAVYRQGQFGVQNTLDAQFWSLQNPASTHGFSRQMGMPGGDDSVDWILGGHVPAGSPVIIRPAPGIGVNSGGSLEAVVPAGGISLDWFHMP